MRKFDHILRSDAVQYFTGGFVQCALAAVVMGFKPHSFEKSPDRLRNVKMRGISGKIKDIKTSFFPLLYFLCHLSLAMDGGVVKDDKSRFVYPFGKIVKPAGKFFARDGISGVKPFIFAIRGHHSEYIESLLAFGGHEDILIFELPAVRHISASAYMAFIPEEEVDMLCTPKFYKFLQLKAFELDQLRRGQFPWTFSYTFISCANKSKKRLKVALLTSLFDSSCHAALAFLMLSLWSLTAFFTAAVSEALINGFGPREPFSRSPSMPDFSYRFTQLKTAIFPYPTMAAISSPFSPSALSRTPWHRILNRWQEPNFRPFSSSERCSAVSFIFFVFPIMRFSYRINRIDRSITFGDEQIVYH